MGENPCIVCFRSLDVLSCAIISIERVIQERWKGQGVDFGEPGEGSALGQGVHNLLLAVQGCLIIFPGRQLWKCHAALEGHLVSRIYFYMVSPLGSLAHSFTSSIMLSFSSLCCTSWHRGHETQAHVDVRCASSVILLWRGQGVRVIEAHGVGHFASASEQVCDTVWLLHLLKVLERKWHGLVRKPDIKMESFILNNIFLLVLSKIVSVSVYILELLTVPYAHYNTTRNTQISRSARASQPLQWETGALSSDSAGLYFLEVHAAG